jgi:hypothetical protein
MEKKGLEMAGNLCYHKNSDRDVPETFHGGGDFFLGGEVMWAAKDGACVLTGMRAGVFADAADWLLWALEGTQGEYPTGSSSFDDLTYGQKVSCLGTIVRGLLQEDVPAVEPTLALEAAIIAVYRELWSLAAAEIDDLELGTTFRARIVAAVRERARECGYDAAWIPDLTATDERTWREQIGRLQAEILEDADDLTAESVADLPGHYAREIRQILGISDEYLLTIPDDLKDEQIQQQTAELHALLRAAVGEVV